MGAKRVRRRFGKLMPKPDDAGRLGRGVSVDKRTPKAKCAWTCSDAFKRKRGDRLDNLVVHAVNDEY